MRKVVHLDEYKKSRIVRFGVEFWRGELEESFNESTTFATLSDLSLMALTEPGDISVELYYGLIIPCVELGQCACFDALSGERKMEVIDIQLFLADRVEYEIMRRVKWVEWYPGESQPIVDLIMTFHQWTQERRLQPAQLAKNHPGYARFSKLIDREKGVFIRKLFSKARQELIK